MYVSPNAAPLLRGVEAEHSLKVYGRQLTSLSGDGDRIEDVRNAPEATTVYLTSDGRARLIDSDGDSDSHSPNDSDGNGDSDSDSHSDGDSESESESHGDGNGDGDI